MSSNNNENITETTNNAHPYFKFEKDAQGKNVLVLHEAYRGVGFEGYPFSQRGETETELELPEMLEIPDEIDGITVETLADGIFAGNKKVKNIKFLTNVKELPAWFCCSANNLRAIHGTGQIKSIGKNAFVSTRIKEALFPVLEELETGAFAKCAYLETADIGKVSTIPMQAFYRCALLREVMGGENVNSIGKEAFFHTRSLRELPLLARVNKVEDGAFFYSRICTSLPAGNGIAEKAFPTVDNKTDFWTNVKFTPRRNRIVTKLSQLNSAWAGETFLLDDDKKYNEACALFAVMHIHSAITGKYYSTPDDFVAELKERDLFKFLTIYNWPGDFTSVAPMFEALGYRTEVHGNGSDLNRQDYQALVDALAEGAYIYTQVGTYSNWEKDWDETEPNAGHAVVIYGINDLGEVCVLDSDVLHESFRQGGLEPNVDIYTYTMPYQNMVGSSSNFVIVYPTKEAECAGCDAANMSTADCRYKSGCRVTDDNTMLIHTDKISSETLPFELPTGVNVSVVTAAADLPENTKGYLIAYNLFSGAANAREEWQPNGSADRYVRFAKNTEEWDAWRVITSASYTSQTGETGSEDE